MTLPSGTILLSQVNTELGISPSTTTINMGATAVRTLAGEPSGAIAMSDLQGKSNASYVAATGGTVTTSGNFKIHVFTSGGTFAVSDAGNAAGSNSVDYNIISGGGGGGRDGGGAGGGGGVRTGTSPVSVQDYPISIGSGGGGGGGSGNGSQGGSSAAFQLLHLAVDLAAVALTVLVVLVDLVVGVHSLVDQVDLVLMEAMVDLVLLKQAVVEAEPLVQMDLMQAVIPTHREVLALLLL